jgi:hypothetical protein
MVEEGKKEGLSGKVVECAAAVGSSGCYIVWKSVAQVGI